MNKIRTICYPKSIQYIREKREVDQIQTAFWSYNFSIGHFNLVLCSYVGGQV